MTKASLQPVKRTVHLKTYESDGCWWAMLYEKLDPPTYPCGAPRSGNAISFSGKDSEDAKKKALQFIRGAKEALFGGLKLVK